MDCGVSGNPFYFRKNIKSEKCMNLPEIPLWVVAIIIVVKTIILIKVHKRMSKAIRICAAVPPVCLALVYVIFSLYPMPTAFQAFFARWSLVVFFTWYAVILLITRKQHI